jgi:hypothetical protein
MNVEYKHLIPENFANESKVFVYQSSRLLTVNEALQLEDLLINFIDKWESHGEKIKGYANLFFGRFIVFMADDTQSNVCGRSIDGLNRFMKEMEQFFAIELLNRQTLAFVVKGKVELLPLPQLKYAVENNFIKADTLFFNNAVSDKQTFLTSWIIPAKDSWLGSKYFTLQNV